MVIILSDKEMQDINGGMILLHFSTGKVRYYIKSFIRSLIALL